MMSDNQVILEAADASGLAYFEDVLRLTSRLDGAEVIRGFVAGLQDGARDE